MCLQTMSLTIQLNQIVVPIDRQQQNASLIKTELATVSPSQSVFPQGRRGQRQAHVGEALHLKKLAVVIKTAQDPCRLRGQEALQNPGGSRNLQKLP